MILLWFFTKNGRIKLFTYLLEFLSDDPLKTPAVPSLRLVAGSLAVDGWFIDNRFCQLEVCRRPGKMQKGI